MDQQSRGDSPFVLSYFSILLYPSLRLSCGSSSNLPGDENSVGREISFPIREAIVPSSEAHPCQSFFSLCPLITWSQIWPQLQEVFGRMKKAQISGQRTKNRSLRELEKYKESTDKEELGKAKPYIVHALLGRLQAYMWSSHRTVYQRLWELNYERDHFPGYILTTGGHRLQDICKEHHKVFEKRTNIETTTHRRLIGTFGLNPTEMTPCSNKNIKIYHTI